jgi:hypothetical protein
LFCHGLVGGGGYVTTLGASGVNVAEREERSGRRRGCFFGKKVLAGTGLRCRVPGSTLIDDRVPADRVLADKVLSDKVLSDKVPDDKALGERSALLLTRPFAPV